MAQGEVGNVVKYGLTTLVSQLRGDNKSCREIAELCTKYLADRGNPVAITMPMVWHYIKTHTTPETIANREIIDSGVQRMVSDIYESTKKLIARCEKILDAQEAKVDPADVKQLEPITIMMEQLRKATQQMMDTVKLVQPQIQQFNQRVITIAETIATDVSLPVDARKRLIGAITDRIIPVDGEKR